MASSQTRDNTTQTTVPLNDLSRSLRSEKAELLAVCERVIDSGWLVHGPEHAAFETELASFVGAQHAIGVASGTDALEIAMRAIAVPGRNVVVVAANCGGYSATAARRAGLQVRYADVNAATHLVTADTLAPVLDDSVALVVVTHLYGRAADIAPIRELASRHGIAVLEDCAQALGARTAEGRVGSLGDAAAFSFYPTKNLGAIGDGGAITTSDPVVAERVTTLRQYGWQGKYTIGTDGGRNSRLDELQAAVLRMRLRKLDENNARRRAIISAYALRASERFTVLPADGPGHTGHLAIVVTDDRDALRTHLDHHGVRSDIHYPIPDHRQPAFADEYTDIALPVTEQLAAQIVSVPVFPELHDQEVEQVCTALETF